MTAPHPFQIGPYRVVRQLGGGGMGQVYLAASASGRAVAVKVIRPELSSDPGFRRRFRAEVAAAKAVSGAYTTPVVDADPDGQPPWLATAYVPGPSLLEAVQTHGPLPEASLRVLGAGIAEALMAVHRAGLIHRDLQPGNILLAGDGPRVIDFGISRALDATGLTVDGEIVGSAGYMSPEHSEGRELTPASDVFSFGALLAYAATARPAFGTGPFHVLMFRAAHEPPQLDGTPPALIDLINACLHKDPAHRPPLTWLAQRLASPRQTSAWLPAALELTVRQREQEQTVVLKTTTARPVRRRVLLLGGGALVAAAAAGAYAVFGPKRGPALPQLAWTATVPNDLLPTSWSPDDTVLICVGPTQAAGLDLETGKELWNDAGAGDTSVVVGSKRVYAMRTDGRLHGLDRKTGRELWVSTPKAGDPPTFAALTSDLILMRDTERRELYAVDSETGKARWTNTRPPGSAVIRDVVAEGLLISVNYGAGRDQPSSYYALSLDKGEERWSKSGYLCAIQEGPGGVCYARDDKNNVLALRTATGDRVWTSPHGLPLPEDNPSTYHYFLESDGTLVCYFDTHKSETVKEGAIAVFDAKNGKKLWSEDPRSISDLSVGPQTVYYIDGTIRAVDLKTGQPRWTTGAGIAPKQRLLGQLGDLLITGTVEDTNGQGGLYGWDVETGSQAWHHPLATKGTNTPAGGPIGPTTGSLPPTPAPC